MTAAQKKVVADVNKQLEGTKVAKIKTAKTGKSNGNKAVKPAAKRTVKPAKRTPKAAPAVKARPDQDSVTGTFQRGKRDRNTGQILPHEPVKGGGVRFEDTQDRGFSPVYLSQSDDKALGKPQRIRVTIKAL